MPTRVRESRKFIAADLLAQAENTVADAQVLLLTTSPALGVRNAGATRGPAHAARAPLDHRTVARGRPASFWFDSLEFKPAHQ